MSRPSLNYVAHVHARRNHVTVRVAKYVGISTVDRWDMVCVWVGGCAHGGDAMEPWGLRWVVRASAMQVLGSTFPGLYQKYQLCSSHAKKIENVWVSLRSCSGTEVQTKTEPESVLRKHLVSKYE